MDIGRKVRAVIEQTYRMEKATAVGSTKRYRVDIFTGGKIRGAPLRQLFKIYESKYFPLYQSHSQKQAGSVSANEKSVDARGNILKGAIFKIVLPFAFLFGAAGIYFIWGFFHPKEQPKDLKKPPAAVAASPGASSVPSLAPKVSDDSPDWRLHGWYSGPVGMVAMLEDNEGRLRHVYMPSNMRITGLDASISLDGVRVFKYSGTVRTNTNAPQVMP
jgi:zona occludens toxin